MKAEDFENLKAGIGSNLKSIIFWDELSVPQLIELSELKSKTPDIKLTEVILFALGDNIKEFLSSYSEEVKNFVVMTLGEKISFQAAKVFCENFKPHLKSIDPQASNEEINALSREYQKPEYNAKLMYLNNNIIEENQLLEIQFNLFSPDSRTLLLEAAGKGRIQILDLVLSSKEIETYIPIVPTLQPIVKELNPNALLIDCDHGFIKTYNEPQVKNKKLPIGSISIIDLFPADNIEIVHETLVSYKTYFQKDEHLKEILASSEKLANAAANLGALTKIFTNRNTTDSISTKLSTALQQNPHILDSLTQLKQTPEAIKELLNNPESLAEVLKTLEFLMQLTPSSLLNIANSLQLLDGLKIEDSLNKLQVWSSFQDTRANFVPILLGSFQDSLPTLELTSTLSENFIKAIGNLSRALKSLGITPETFVLYFATTPKNLLEAFEFLAQSQEGLGAAAAYLDKVLHSSKTPKDLFETVQYLVGGYDIVPENLQIEVEALTQALHCLEVTPQQFEHKLLSLTIATGGLTRPYEDFIKAFESFYTTPESYRTALSNLVEACNNIVATPVIPGKSVDMSLGKIFETMMKVPPTLELILDNLGSNQHNIKDLKLVDFSHYPKLIDEMHRLFSMRNNLLSTVDRVGTPIEKLSIVNYPFSKEMIKKLFDVFKLPDSSLKTFNGVLTGEDELVFDSDTMNHLFSTPLSITRLGFTFYSASDYKCKMNQQLMLTMLEKIVQTQPQMQSFAANVSNLDEEGIAKVITIVKSGEFKLLNLNLSVQNSFGEPKDFGAEAKILSGIKDNPYLLYFNNKPTEKFEALKAAFTYLKEKKYDSAEGTTLEEKKAILQVLKEHEKEIKYLLEKESNFFFSAHKDEICTKIESQINNNNNIQKLVEVVEQIALPSDDHSSVDNNNSNELAAAVNDMNLAGNSCHLPDND